MKTTGLDRTQYYGWHAFPQGKHAQVFDQSMPPTRWPKKYLDSFVQKPVLRLPPGIPTMRLLWEQ